ncbi:acetoin utilization deacetylase AcuC-like enzyme [Amaricoccus macauensis]|uniref:Acetoin utilization deacetylase AcuC-like enzyme n=1 Tax=Amaricoccus macauensis TaxID=57001 RepID=A0A840SQ46_9RHOB|nr:histone deacetylase family protein [Amaricoccus macauensis]MBB5221493.1 acetoin utilization deacetylase AcuC-like enzyme [Amaricoccus macauensis]
MQTVYSPRHAGHSGNNELQPGAIVPAFELPRRAELIRASVEAAGLGPIREPDTHDLSIAMRLHAPDYVEFLSRVWGLWQAAGRDGPAMPFIWPRPGLRCDVPPADIDGLLGFYSMDAGATFVAGTWDAVKSSHDVALSAAALVAGGERAAFALCRPPGHHAGARFAGGYCYINNAAVAAESFRLRGAGKVTVLDVDYHHGNGTQDMFYERGDVQVVNIHADPMVEFPYFLGHADERGAGAGEGANLNLPLPHGTDFGQWSEAYAVAATAIARFAPDVVVVSLGVDTFHGDPISQFRLDTIDYPLMGAGIAALGLPTLFVMEGGYAVEAIGENVAGLLRGFADA